MINAELRNGCMRKDKLQKLLPSKEMGDPNLVNLTDDSLEDFSFNSFSSEVYTPDPSLNIETSDHNFTERPVKQPRPIGSQVSFPSSKVISFGSPPACSHHLQGSKQRNNSYSEGCEVIERTTRTPLQAQNHIMAERRRRERLNQRLIALSAIIPGLKKMDKATVIGDAIKYIKELEERVQKLEEEACKKDYFTEVPAAANCVRTSRLLGDDKPSSSTDSFNQMSAVPPLLDIEVRDMRENVLVRVLCEKQEGLIARALGELERFRLRIISCSVLPFGELSLDITVVAQMDTGFCMTVDDLMKSLRLALLKFM
ncbi:hypothetical protein NMG60_11014412 [Bertholletia excelsa]